jgi:transcriptional regulator with XRE-family HTH domain
VAEPPVTFAGQLRKLRAEARLTQQELAEATGLSPRSISGLEGGKAHAGADAHLLPEITCPNRVWLASLAP